MALDFPNSPPPTEGQLYVGANGITYVFSGGKWVGQGASGSNVTTTTDSLLSGSFVIDLDTTGNLNIPADGDVVRNGLSIFDAVETLQANSTGADVAAANVQIGLLWANAAVQATALNTINANVAAANLAVAALSANVGNLVSNAPAALDTLFEIANSLGNNASLSTTLMTAISGVRANVNAANAEIASTNANLAAFSTYANLTFTGGGNANTGLITFNDNTIIAASNRDFYIESKDDNDVVRAYFRLDPGNGLAEMRARGNRQTDSFSGGWATAEWTGTGNSGQLTFTGANDLQTFFDNDLSGAVAITISINGGEFITYDGTASGGGNIIFYTNAAPPADPTTVTIIEFRYYRESRIEINSDDEDIDIYGDDLNIDITSTRQINITGTNSVNIVSDQYAQLQSNGNYVWVDNSGAHIEINTGGTFDFEHVGGTTRLKLPAGGDIVDSTGASVLGGGGGNADRLVNDDLEVVLDSSGNLTIPGDIIGTTTIDIDNRASGNSADIRLYSADDILLQARDRSAGSGTEGGDINIYAGDSAEDGDTTGGDIQIYAGDGGAANVDIGGSGGFVRIQSGRGGAASTIENGDWANNGGELILRANDAGSNMGNIARGARGGVVTIESGDSTGNSITGGSITLRTGLGGPNATAGDVIIDIPLDDQGLNKEWIFSANGALTAPGDIVVGGVDGGHFYIDGTDGDNTSVRWYNMPVGQDHNIIRTFTGNTDQGTDLNRGRIQLAWQDNDRSGLRIVSYDRSDEDNNENVVQHEWTFQGNGGLRFPDDTIQTTAYRNIARENLMLDGGAAATIYEVTVDYAEGGFSSTRYGVNTPSFNGGTAELEEAIYYTLDGGGA